MPHEGDLRRPAPDREQARALARAPDREGHERTGVAVYVAITDRTGAAEVVAPQPVLGDGARVAGELSEWHALLGDDADPAGDVDGGRGLAGARRAPPHDPGWTPPALGLPAPAATRMAELTAASVAGRLLRVVNFHSTPDRLAGRVAAELADHAARYTPMSAADLDAALVGTWPASVAQGRPAVVLASYDGFANNARVAAPVLDRLGVPAWLHLPTGLPDAAPGEQPAFARRHATAASVTTPEDLEREGLTPLRRVADVTGAAAGGHGGAGRDALRRRAPR